jgi:hypothetical protein
MGVFFGKCCGNATLKKAGRSTVRSAQANAINTCPHCAARWTIYLPNDQLSSLVTQKFGLAVPTADLLLVSPLTLAWLEGDIENAVGSIFSDEIHGNDLANVLTGGLGNDYLYRVPLIRTGGPIGATRWT